MELIIISKLTGYFDDLDQIWNDQQENTIPLEYIEYSNDNISNKNLDYVDIYPTASSVPFVKFCLLF